MKRMFEVIGSSPIFSRGTIVEGRCVKGGLLFARGKQSNGCEGENPIEVDRVKPLGEEAQAMMGEIAPAATCARSSRRAS